MAAGPGCRSLSLSRLTGPGVLLDLGMAQQARADQSDAHDHAGAKENARLGPLMGEAVSIDHGPDRLAKIEKRRVERGGGAARGLRKFGHVDLDTPVQKV